MFWQLFLAVAGLLSYLRSYFPIGSPHFIEKKREREREEADILIHLSFLPCTADVWAREPSRTLLFIVTVVAAAAKKEKKLFCTVLLSAPTTEMQLFYFLSIPPSIFPVCPCCFRAGCIIHSSLSWAVEWKPWRESRAGEARRRGDKEAVRAPPVVLRILSRLCFTRGLSGWCSVCVKWTVRRPQCHVFCHVWNPLHRWMCTITFPQKTLYDAFFMHASKEGAKVRSIFNVERSGRRSLSAPAISAGGVAADTRAGITSKMDSWTGDAAGGGGSSDIRFQRAAGRLIWLTLGPVSGPGWSSRTSGALTKHSVFLGLLACTLLSSIYQSTPRARQPPRTAAAQMLTTACLQP